MFRVEKYAGPKPEARTTADKSEIMTAISSIMKMEAVVSSEMLVPIYQNDVQTAAPLT
jgi:hypothetical protein